MMLSSDVLAVLADASLKVAALMLVAAGTARVLRRAPAVARQLVWTFALAGALVLPLLAAWLPPLPIVVPAQVRTAAATALAAPAPGIAIIRAAATPAGRRSVLTSAPPIARSMTTASPVEPASRMFDWRAVFFTIWLTGAMALLARLACGFHVVRQLCRRATRVTDPAWSALLDTLAAASGITPRPALLKLRSAAGTMTSMGPSVPMTCGLFSQSIVLPSGADDWSTERRQAVLLHELGHVKRADCATQLLAQTACALYWFHPLVWIGARRLRIERELACDDGVLEMGTGAADYAAHLLAIASGQPRGHWPEVFTFSAGTTIAMARRSQLEARLQAILDPAVRRAGSPARGRSIALAALVVVVTVAAIEPQAAQTIEVPPTLLRTPPLSQSREAVVDGVAGGLSERVATPGTMQQRLAQQVAQPIAQAMAQPLAQLLAQPEPQPAPEAQAAPEPGARPDQARPRPSGITPEQRERLVAAFGEALKDTDPEVREQAVRALGQSGNPAHIDAVITALNDANADVRQQAAWSLGAIGEARAVVALATAIKDRIPDVRQQAAWSLGAIGDARGVDPLLVALKDADGDVRQQAAWSLGAIGEARAAVALAAALKDEKADVRQQAAWSLGAIGDEAAVGALIGALTDAVADVREQAAWSLGAIGDVRAIDALTALLKDQSSDVRKNAIWALGVLAGDMGDDKFEYRDRKPTRDGKPPR